MLLAWVPIGDAGGRRLAGGWELLRLMSQPTALKPCQEDGLSHASPCSPPAIPLAVSHHPGGSGGVVHWYNNGQQFHGSHSGSRAGNARGSYE